MTEQRRKPLRRTAWTLLIGGFVSFAVVIGIGLLVRAGGEDIGPGRPAMVPAGERMSLHKHLGLPADKANTPSCDLFGPGGERTYIYPSWGESVSSPTEVTIKCEREVILLTGRASAVAAAVQGPLFAAPLAVMIAGLLLFFPRFTLAWARLSNRWPRLPR